MGVYYAYENLAVSTSAVGLTAATYGDSNGTFITVEGAPVRYRMDKVDPTSSVGHLLDIGDALKLFGHGELQNVRFISADGNAATLRCSYGNVS